MSTQLLAPFDATQYDPTQGGGGFPIGKHPVVIEGGEVRATKGNDGGMAVLFLKIVDGPSVGTSGEYRLNLYNKSAKAVEIANRQMSAVCHVTGIFQVTDLSQFAGRNMIIEVGYQDLTDEQKARKAAGEQVTPYTEIKKVYDMNGNEPGKPARTAAPVQNGFAAPQAQQLVQQPAQQPQQQQPAWGAPQQSQQQPAPVQQPAATPGWGAPAQQPQQQPQNAGFQANAGAPATPAWGAPR